MTDTKTTFDVTVSGTYSAYEVPPRCRKPRYVRHAHVIVVPVPAVSHLDAPVAMLVESEPVRFYEGYLYSPFTPASGQTEPTQAGSVHFESTREAEHFGSSAEEFEKKAGEWLGQFLIVDDEVWQRTGEPRYVVQTFGFGSNHGGTALFPDWHDNRNIAADSYFRADQFEEARQVAIGVAERRRDTESVERLRLQKKPQIEVLIPEAVQLHVPTQETAEARELRWDFAHAVRRYSDTLNNSRDDALTPEAEAEAWNALVEQRGALVYLTKDVPGYHSTRRPTDYRDEEKS